MTHIIKEFAEFEGIKDTNNFKVAVFSHSNLNDLTTENVDLLMDLYHNEEYQDFINGSDRKIIKGVDDHPTAIWQVDKMREFETKFFDNLDYNIEDDKVFAHSEFEIGVSDDFEEESVIEWTEGFSRLCAIHPMDYKRNMMDKTLYEKEKNFLQQLKKNEEIKVERI